MAGRVTAREDNDAHLFVTEILTRMQIFSALLYYGHPTMLICQIRPGDKIPFYYSCVSAMLMAVLMPLHLATVLNPGPVLRI
jgi:hypothetical protein